MTLETFMNKASFEILSEKQPDLIKAIGIFLVNGSSALAVERWLKSRIKNHPFVLDLCIQATRHMATLEEYQGKIKGIEKSPATA